MKTFVIAEAGANHNRNFKQALKLIDVAKESGASAVKFQTYSSKTLYSKNTPNFAGYKNINKLIKDIELPREWQKDLKQYCDETGIEFMSTPFDEKAVDELVNLKVKRLKISGFESTDFRFVNMVASSKLPLVISLGIGFKMNYLGKIFEIADKYGNELSFMYCNNAYPTPIEDAGIGIVRQLSQDTRYKWGLSDHTESPFTPALAVAAGATIIEKHFTLSKKLPGPDHPFALEPDELKQMVDNIRFAELSIQKQSSDEISTSEQTFTKAMRSVVTKVNLKKGDILTKDNITTKRPFLKNSIPAMDFENVIGYPIDKDIIADTPLLQSNVPKYYYPLYI
jgi:N,N'-diacetyllegionaminate synthase